MKHDIQSVGKSFQIEGEFLSAELYLSGHINDTYIAAYRHGGTSGRYVHQRINHGIFRDPVSLMDNISRVTRHLVRRLREAGVDCPERKTMTLVPSREGRTYHRDDAGNFWRTYYFIEGGRTYETVRTADQAYEVAKAFGRFQEMLIDLPGPRLTETIVDFHNGTRRFRAFESAVEQDAVNRCRTAEREIEFAFRRRPTVSVLTGLHERGEIPERITHNDTKLNNVILDDATGKGICVVDLDTVMPGLVHYDFGDMIRTATSPAGEDAEDLSEVRMQMPMFEALVEGYVESAGGFLTETEKRYLPFSGKFITFLIGLRFLTDYLSGDTYFKIHRPEHNLDRCRAQFKLVESIEEQEDAMNRLMAKF